MANIADDRPPRRLLDEPRTLSQIAAEIRRVWPKPYFGAVPYIDAMTRLENVDDQYGADNGRYIVNYFLANATGWRGEDARRIKAELKKMLSTKKKG